MKLKSDRAYSSLSHILLTELSFFTGCLVILKELIQVSSSSGGFSDNLNCVKEASVFTQDTITCFYFTMCHEFLKGMNFF